MMTMLPSSGDLIYTKNNWAWRCMSSHAWHMLNASHMLVMSVRVFDTDLCQITAFYGGSLYYVIPHCKHVLQDFVLISSL